MCYEGTHARSVLADAGVIAAAAGGMAWWPLSSDTARLRRFRWVTVICAQWAVCCPLGKPAVADVADGHSRMNFWSLVAPSFRWAPCC